jgi:hypothetical protein
MSLLIYILETLIESYQPPVSPSNFEIGANTGVRPYSGIIKSGGHPQTPGPSAEGHLFFDVLCLINPVPFI